MQIKSMILGAGVVLSLVVVGVLSYSEGYERGRADLYREVEAMSGGGLTDIYLNRLSDSPESK